MSFKDEESSRSGCCWFRFGSLSFSRPLAVVVAHNIINERYINEFDLISGCRKKNKTRGQKHYSKPQRVRERSYVLYTHVNLSGPPRSVGQRCE